MDLPVSEQRKMWLFLLSPSLLLLMFRSACGSPLSSLPVSTVSQLALKFGKLLLLEVLHIPKGLEGSDMSLVCWRFSLGSKTTAATSSILPSVWISASILLSLKKTGKARVEWLLRAMTSTFHLSD